MEPANHPHQQCVEPVAELCRSFNRILCTKGEYIWETNQQQNLDRKLCVALTSGLSRKQVASDFGIGFSTLRRWIKEERDTVSTPEPQIDLIHENERLRKEVRMLREEREILKKVTLNSQYFQAKP